MYSGDKYIVEVWGVSFYHKYAEVWREEDAQDIVEMLNTKGKSCRIVSLRTEENGIRKFNAN